MPGIKQRSSRVRDALCSRLNPRTKEMTMTCDELNAQLCDLLQQMAGTRLYLVCQAQETAFVLSPISTANRRPPAELRGYGRPASSGIWIRE
jgi:hypothetical protein